MIILDNIYKINLLYKNYIRQYSKEYLKGNTLYIGDCLINNNSNLKKNLYIKEFVKTYKNNFFKLLMNNCKVYAEIEDSQLCLICLDNLDLFDVEHNICNNCNIKCHKKCIETWYKNNKNICPICLKNKTEINVIDNSIQQYNYDNNNNDNYDNNDNIWKFVIAFSIFSIVICVIYISVNN